MGVITFIKAPVNKYNFVYKKGGNGCNSSALKCLIRRASSTQQPLKNKKQTNNKINK